MIQPDTTYPFNLSKFHAFIQSLYRGKYIFAWWHYLPGGLYFIDTTLTVNQIYVLLIKYMPNHKHIIMEVNPKNQQGWLNKEAWDWFGPYKD